jgi:hypothetical protein
MIVNSNIANEQRTSDITTMTVQHLSSSLPHREVVTVASMKSLSMSEANVVAKDSDHDINPVINEQHQYYSMGLAKIQMRLVISLMFAVLPGVTQLPSLARSAVPVPDVPAVVTAASSSSNEMISSQRQSMDAARLLLDDSIGKRRPKIPDSIKKQMDLQDRRLSICQELSRDEWEWEQCFYYGTDTGGGGALYFDSGMFVENKSNDNNNPADKTPVAKQKIPTW